jgi:hypothetical protein
VAILGRVINFENSGKDRQRLIREIIVVIRELAKVEVLDDNTRNLVSLIILNLWMIYKGIDSSVLAWEKRGYWVKADRFRMEWDWTKSIADRLTAALFTEDWVEVRNLTVYIAQKFSKVTIPINHRIKTPWIGAWNILNKHMPDK